MHAKEEPIAWVIGNGYSNCMTGDRRKFINVEGKNGG